MHATSDAQTVTIEVCTTNGVREDWKVPTERKIWESFRDAESLNGQVALLSRRLLPGGFQDEVKLTNIRGEVLSVGKILASDSSGVWNPSDNAILFPPYEFSPLNMARTMGGTHTFDIWDYSSNAVQNVHTHN